MMWSGHSHVGSHGCFVITGTVEYVYDDGTGNESCTVAWDAESICKCQDALPTGRISTDLLSAGPQGFRSY